MSESRTVIPLQAAVKALNARKAAVRGTPAPCASYVGENGLRMMMVGLDVDLHEAAEVAFTAAAITAEGIVEGHAPYSMLQGLWVDGFLTGMMLGELRARESETERPA